MQSLVSWIKCSDQRQIPVSIDFFTTDQKTFIDTFEDYSWEWPTEMFTNCHVVNVHGYQLNVPNPPGVYLSHVYGDFGDAKTLSLVIQITREQNQNQYD